MVSGFRGSALDISTLRGQSPRLCVVLRTLGLRCAVGGVGRSVVRMDGRTRMWPLRRFATRFVDPILRPLAGKLPAFAIVEHRGRSTGTLYRTPVNVFRRGDAYLFFLTYGSDAQWVKNVLAAGTCRIETRGVTVDLVAPRLITDPELTAAPPVARFVERHLAGATQYLRMQAAPSAPPRS
jgi:deazaflavin-dependent oxidoreductase (nitroreductase family)